jgi:F0F1-type ATP synthase membrane subunit b/b'
MQETLSIILPIVIAHGVILALLVLIIRQLLLGDTKKAVARINEVEAEVRKKEESIRREIDEHEKDFEQRKSEAEAELMRHKNASEKEVAELKETMVADAKKESAQIIEMAHKNEAKFRAQLAQELEEKAVAYAAEIFHLVFSERMGKELHRQFMSELLDALAEVDGANITIDNDDSEFVSGFHIDDDQRTRFEGILKDKFNIDVKVKEKIDQELLAGMNFKLGSLEIDASLRNRYMEATEEVKKMAHQATV